MQQYITVDQLKTLSPLARIRLEDWFADTYEWDDDPVYVYIPEEERDEHDGMFKGQWDSERSFIYPEEYSGKIKNHQGTVLPILDITQMVQFLNERDNDDLAFRLHLLIHEGKRETGNKWSFDADALCTSLWEGVKTILQREEPEQKG